ncbi:S-layer homology domain-containing protein [Bacillus pacificus]|uniref:S-layer homology domain-containing protein n=1 Tax=Bacillus pacificus TaxID=2026187 RepID=UPI001E53F953|nr:S-layer homology domain-containing protein [Bacillus pacificus]MCC2388715.1 S-layer homology domain-containing protein [Bacillus pacificus]
MAKNKSFNKLMAGTMTAAMVAGVVAPVAASASENAFPDVQSGQWYTKAINEMAAKKIISGMEDGTFGLGQDVTRAQVATFMVKAKDIKTGSTKTPFTDVNEKDWFAPYVSAAEANKIMAGLGDNKFGPNEKLTRAQMAQLLVNAYGFKADENNKVTFNDIDGLSWATAKSSIETLASLGLVTGYGDGTFQPNKVVSREEAAQFIYNAMNYKQPEAKVVSATPINAKQVEVKFGTEVNVDTKDLEAAKKLFTLGDKELTAVEVAKDNKTVVLTFNEVHGIEDAVLVVNPIATKADAKVKTAKHTQVISYKDTVRPTVKGVEYVNTNTAKIIFSEPVKNLGNATGTNGVGEVKLAEDGKSATVDLTSVKENTEAVVTIVGATDFAGNLISPNPVKVNVKKQAIDKTAPTVTGVEAVANNQLKVTFSKDFTETELEKGITVDTGKKDENGKVVPVTVEKVEFDKDNSKVAYVTLKEDLRDGINTIKIAKETVDSTLTPFKEAYSKQLVVSIKAEAAPELTKSEVVTEKDNQFLVLTYNKEVKSGELATLKGDLYSDYVTSTNIDFVAADKVKVDEKDKKVVKIDLKDVKAGKWTVKLADGFVKDAAKDTLASKAKTITFDVEATKDPVSSLTYTVESSEDGKKVFVNFAGKVDGASATNAANYAIEGAAVEKAVLTSNTEKSATVELTLKAGSVEADGNYAISVKGVKDTTKSVEAKAAEKDSKIVTLTENVAPTVEKAELKNGKDLEITFSEAVKDVDTADFIVLLDGKDVTKELGTDKNITVTKVEGTDASKATFTFSRALDSKELAKTLTVKPNKEGVTVTDNKGNKLAAFESIIVKNIIK